MTNAPPPDSQFAYGVSPSRKAFGSFMTALVVGCAILAALPLVSILWTVVTNGISHLDPKVFTELPPPPMVKGGGFRNALMGSLSVLLLASLLSVPFGILVAVYVSEFARDTKFSKFVRFGINVLSGVPSIVAGLFAYGVVVLAMGSFSAWAGGVALAVLMLPIVERTAEEGLKSIPPDIRQGAIGLGATNFQTISQIVLPSAMPFIATGVTLSLARAIGETAPLLFTALFNQFDAKSLSEPTATLSVLIYNFSTSPFKNQKDLAWVAALLVLVIILVISIVARRIAKRQVF
jgi:phosphate transport system permease protein